MLGLPSIIGQMYQTFSDPYISEQMYHFSQFVLLLAKCIKLSNLFLSLAKCIKLPSIITALPIRLFLVYALWSRKLTSSSFYFYWKQLPVQLVNVVWYVLPILSSSFKSPNQMLVGDNHDMCAVDLYNRHKDGLCVL